MPSEELYLQMDDSPQAVLSRMAELGSKIRRLERRHKRLWTAGCLLTGAGVLAFLLLFPETSLRLYFFSALLIFLPIGVALLIASRRYELSPRFAVAQEILSVLRDDVERVAGTLDLTRPTDRSKRVRTARSGGGKQKVYYRNPWLRIKLKLVDGNTLQLSLVDKIKTKAGSVVRSSTKIAAKLAINADLYAQSETLSELHVPGYEVSSGPDHVLLTGYLADAQDLSAQQLLSKIRTLFGYLEPVGQAAM